MECCFCKEYNSLNDNQYYNLLGKKIDEHSRILVESDNWYVLPTLGCLTVGYVLLVCKQHYQSLANLSPMLYQEMLEIKDIVEKRIFKQLGLCCLAFEHGTTDLRYTGANSVEHVHLHIMPYTKTIWPTIAKENGLDDFVMKSNYRELMNEWNINHPKTYLFFQDIDKFIYYKSNAKGFQSQYFRKCLAPHLGTGQWDWKDEFHENNFIKTLELFRDLT